MTLTGTWTQGAEHRRSSRRRNTFELASRMARASIFTGLPAGTTYTVTEAPYAANGYEAASDELPRWK